MKKLLSLSFYLFSLMAVAQNENKGIDKLDAQLKLWVSDYKALYNQHPSLYKNGIVYDPMISVIFKSYEANTKALVEKYKGQLYSSLGVIYTAEIPLSQVLLFANENNISKIESSKEMELNNDKAKVSTGVSKVHNWELDNKPYTGNGVIVGIVDSGIDFLHPDFLNKNDTTKTRILNIWDQTINGGNTPVGYNYGSEWNKTQIDAELTVPGIVTERDSSGHGTHVTGSAAGNRGMAYYADIISVKTPLVSNGDYKFATSAKTLDGVNYIYKKAIALNKPCVVNMSLGFNFGAPHDGTSLFEQGIDYMVSSRNGFIVCASAGNEGGSYGHNGGYQLTNDSVWIYINALNGATWYGVNNNLYDDSIEISVIMDSATASFTGSGIMNQKTVFQSPWLKIKDIKSASGGLNFDILYGNGDTAANLRLVAASYDSARTEFYVYPRDKFIVSTAVSPSKVNLFKISFRGAGTFHSWYQELYGLGVNLANFNAKTNTHYKTGDDNFTIGIPATAKKVLAVGAYLNKKDFTDILGRKQVGLNTNNAPVGRLAFFSSIGPTLDNRQKPEFCAPGLNVASSLSRYAHKDSTSMIDPLTVVYSGTSMSCPVTTGAVALYLEKFPTTNYDLLKNAIITSTIKDIYTNSNGSLPNSYWGNGKLDIFKAMGGKWNTGITENGEFLDNTIVYPNPANREIYFNLPTHQTFESIQLFDMKGNLVKNFTISTENKEIMLDITNLSNGIYFYKINGNSLNFKGKILVNN